MNEMEQFQCDQKFSRLITESEYYIVGQTRHYAGVVRTVAAITCIMEAGEMAGVPWFIISFEDNANEIKVNGKFVVEVTS